MELVPLLECRLAEPVLFAMVVLAKADRPLVRRL
jgi:hypothetical protein